MAVTEKSTMRTAANCIIFHGHVHLHIKKKKKFGTRTLRAREIIKFSLYFKHTACTTQNNFSSLHSVSNTTLLLSDYNWTIKLGMNLKNVHSNSFNRNYSLHYAYYTQVLLIYMSLEQQVLLVGKEEKKYGLHWTYFRHQNNECRKTTEHFWGGATGIFGGQLLSPQSSRPFQRALMLVWHLRMRDRLSIRFLGNQQLSNLFFIVHATMFFFFFYLANTNARRISKMDNVYLISDPFFFVFFFSHRQHYRIHVIPPLSWFIWAKIKKKKNVQKYTFFDRDAQTSLLLQTPWF